MDFRGVAGATGNRNVTRSSWHSVSEDSFAASDVSRGRYASLPVPPAEARIGIWTEARPRHRQPDEDRLQRARRPGGYPAGRACGDLPNRAVVRDIGEPTGLEAGKADLICACARVIGELDVLRKWAGEQGLVLSRRVLRIGVSDRLNGEWRRADQADMNRR